jgi:hypothetical protein
VDPNCASTSISIEPVPNLTSPLRSVIRAMQCELDELVQQKAALTRRARNLRRQLSARSPIPPSGPIIKRENSPDTKRRYYRRSLDNSSRLTGQFSDERLKRACRIALMEAEGEATPDRILALISRRGSIVFRNQKEDPISLIICALNVMCDFNEARLSIKGQDLYYHLLPEAE